MGAIRSVLSAIVRRLAPGRLEYKCVPGRVIADPTPGQMNMSLLAPDERAEAEALLSKIDARATGGPELSDAERDRYLDLNAKVRWELEPGYEDLGIVYYGPAENAALVSADALAVMLRQGGMRCAVEKNDDGEVDIVLEADHTALLLTVDDGFVSSVVVDQTFVDERAKAPRVCELLESLGWVREEE